jgi:hypothetical protein
VRRVIPIAAQPNQPARANAEAEAAEAAKLEGGNKVNYRLVVEKYKAKITNRTSAIRAFCIECSGGMVSEVRVCAVTKCALYPFRMGDDPFRKKRNDGFVGAKNEESEQGEE